VSEEAETLSSKTAAAVAVAAKFHKKYIRSIYTREREMMRNIHITL
jgi:hypothetical protein